MMFSANILGSFQKWNIGATVRDLLLSNENLRAMVNEHIYPCIAPENTTGDFIVYKRETYSKLEVKQGVYEDDCKLSLTVISDNYDNSVKIAEEIDTTLIGQHLINTDDEQKRVRFELTDSSEGWEDNKYFQILLITIK